MRIAVAAGAATLSGTATHGQDAPLTVHRVHVLHDAQGNILGFTIPAGKYAGGIRSIPQPGHQVSIIERKVPSGPQGHRQIAEELMHSRIQLGPNAPQVVPKERRDGPSPVPAKVELRRVPRDRRGRFGVPR
jgi:hypothetical protein